MHAAEATLYRADSPGIVISRAAGVGKRRVARQALQVDAAAHAALAYRRRGYRGSALACSQRVAALSEQCGGARTPALRSAIERVPLTDREREIVMFIGQGSSTRKIADRLTLSARTVEGH